MAEDNQFGMEDPTKQYSQPTIPSNQSQPEPGLDSKLRPQADHGETSYKGLGRLSGRKALITGADSGIGRAVAIAFAREGSDMALSYLPEEESDVQSLLPTLKDTGKTITPIPGDISNELFCRALIDNSLLAMGSIDILVNNAGKQVYVESIDELTSQQFVTTFATNVFAMFWLCKYALPHMPAGSTIINTASIQAYQPSPGLLDYASTKSAIVGFTKALAKQLAPKGIRVNAVAPGPIWTPLQPSHGQPPEKLEQFGKNTPLGRAGQPAELAPTYVFLASQESSYITAEVIGVTGGNHLP